MVKTLTLPVLPRTTDQKRMSYQFPKHPGQPRPNPFAGADGNNPFADSSSPPAPADANPYAASGAPAMLATSAVPPQEFETTLAHRGGTVFWFGLIGLLGSTAGIPCLYFMLPVPIFSLSLSIPAWLMGRNDLRAMKSGAMDSSGRRQTRAGYVMGLIGTFFGGLISVLLFAGLIYLIYYVLSVTR